MCPAFAGPSRSEETMNRKWIGIIIILLGLILAAGIIYVLFFYDFSPASPTAKVTPKADDSKTAPAAVTPKTETKKVFEAQKPAEPKTVGEDDLKRIAALFAERYGSYSNQSNYRNLRDLKIFMTAKMQAWTDNYIKEAIAKKTDASIYYGISTKAISYRVEKFDEDAGMAKIIVNTQRKESIADTSNSGGFAQEIEIYFKKESNVWKVDEAVWQSKTARQQRYIFQ
jgi:hypothetical protein